MTPRHIKVFFFLLALHVVRLQARPLQLWYTAPAKIWEASLPLGNGRLGAMPDGGIHHEKIVLNDITLWSGARQDADKPGASKHLREIQNLLLAGKNREAQQVMGKYFISAGAGSGSGDGANVPYGSYQLLGNLHINYQYGQDSSAAQVTAYKRELSIDKAVASTQLTVNNVGYRREYLTSFDKDLIVIRLSSNVKGKLNCDLSLDRPEHFQVVAHDIELEMSGQLPNGSGGGGMKYAAHLQVKTADGKLVATQNKLLLRGATTAVIYLSAGTNFRHNNYQTWIRGLLRAGKVLSYNKLKQTHITSFQELFNRVSLKLPGDTTTGNVPTDERLRAFSITGKDPGLAALYFQYGRYLLISSTRPGLLPPNLQGLWANTIHTPWNGDYHLNINIQMNHWPLHVANLGSLNAPFFDFVEGLVPNGQLTAQRYYNSDGWVAHVISNIWNYTSPGEDYSWGSFNTGSAWLCQMLWTHYLYTQDINYLKKLYPILKGSARFYLTSMVTEPEHGWLVTAPSNSPENAFILPDGQQAHVTYGPTIDNQLIRYLFKSVISAAEVLKLDAEFKNQVANALSKLPPTRVGSDGRIMEWIKEYKEADPQHRHLSHLWGLYPGNEIVPEDSTLAAAAKKSIEMRGEAGTGWSLAWKMNFWARLHNGQRAYRSFMQLLRPVTTNKVNMSNGGGTYPNLFCAHPPFQIDGNFGGTAGIAEMLIQSQSGTIELLPALPDEWPSGNFSGLCVQGNGEVSVNWKNKQVNAFTLKAGSNHVFKIKLPSYYTHLKAKIDGKACPLTTTQGIATVKLLKGQLLQISAG